MLSRMKVILLYLWSVTTTEHTKYLAVAFVKLDFQTSLMEPTTRNVKVSLWLIFKFFPLFPCRLCCGQIFISIFFILCGLYVVDTKWIFLEVLNILWYMHLLGKDLNMGSFSTTTNKIQFYVIVWISVRFLPLHWSGIIPPDLKDLWNFWQFEYAKGSLEMFNLELRCHGN